MPPPPSPASTTSISAAVQGVPAGVAAIYDLSLSPDRVSLTVDPRQQPSRRARDIRGFSVEDSARGGKIITLAGRPFRDGTWVRSTFRRQVQSEAQLEQLRRAGYDPERERDLLVVQGERDAGPTVFAFSADASKPGLVGVCADVTIIDFGPGAYRPIAVRKPVIYLRPAEETEVRVEVAIDGDFVAQYPKTHEGAWTVRATPEGALIDAATGRRHRYLFWEGTSAGFEVDPSQAHLVASEDAAGFLERACGRFALTDEECGDFVTYWLPALARNPYSVVHFVDEARYGRYARMQVTPEPDAVIRLFMVFRRSEAPVWVGAPELPQRRRGRFTVVEWGGADLDERGPEIR